MEYRMKEEWLKNHCLNKSTEDEKYMVEEITNNTLHEWSDKLEIFLRLCDYYAYIWRFYEDGRVVLQMIFENTADSETEWKGCTSFGHLEYQSLDDMLFDWCEKLKSENADNFAEEIAFIENMRG